VLSLPDLQQPFEIETNSSDYVVATILTQHVHPLAYHSETLSYIICKYLWQRNVLHCTSLPQVEALHYREGDNHPH
jgi:hypothetical protein